MSYEDYKKIHWNIGNRNVRFYTIGNKIRLAILYSSKLGLVLKHEFKDICDAIRVAEAIEAKRLINTECWNKIYYPYKYKMWKGNHAILTNLVVE